MISRILNYLRYHLLPDIREAIGQIAHHQLRSALTLLGMVFGVGAVISMLAVSEGGRIQSMQMIEGMGVRNLIVHADEPTDDSLREIRQHSIGLSLADAKAIKDTLSFVDAWSGINIVNTWGLFSYFNQSSGEVWAVSPTFFELSALEAAIGDLFTDTDNENFAQKAVLGSTIAKTLFPNGDAVGSRIKVNYVWFEVIGVLRDRQLPGDSFQGEQVGGESDRVYIPLQTGLKRLTKESWAPELSILKVKINESVEVSTAAVAIQHLIDRRHGNQQDTAMIVPARLLAQQRQTQRIFTIVMSAVAGISLLVGGIGIMNIMLASVMERRSEIGLLRAVGARQLDIVRHFLIETAVIAIAGAVAGVIVGVVIAYTIAAFANWAVAWSAIGNILAITVCIAFAVGFGVYPALSAAKLDPVVALQSE